MPEQWRHTQAGQRWIARYVATRRRGWPPDQTKAHLCELGLPREFANRVADWGEAVLDTGSLARVLPLLGAEQPDAA